ncbi:phosphoadenylyl-sulfate reductase [Flaviaesturariibacter amylovorans]|uniref:Adenosine 5'-phosphosulfate reductase n=1 Tax=Flaviaesturariibacter amylovorans TaxID=1084520 RepID=A0ABP8H1H1_9BACT
MQYLLQLRSAFAELSLPEALRLGTTLFPGAVCFSTSLGQEDQVLTDIIARSGLPVRLFTLDTGRLFEETYATYERTVARYKLPIDVFFPKAEAVQELAARQGVNGFYESVAQRQACCGVRKVEPLARALRGARVWITGLRAEQNDHRKSISVVEWDADRELYKINPLLHWSYEEVLAHLRQYNVPYNPLHDQGFLSIGCAPCTRAVEPGEEARAGRWWWEQSHKECGLHLQR